MAADIGFIGIGMMGYGMASNVRKKMPSSATLYIYDVVEAASRRFKDQFSSFGPIEIVQSSKEAAEKSGTLISMVPTGNDAREVYLNPTTGVIASSPNPDRLILESSTIDVATTQDIAKAITEAGIGTYLDTPVSGGVRGAEAGTLSFFLGYPDDSTQDPLKERIRQTINYMAKAERVSFCGKLGAGLVCKIVNNYIGLSNMVTAAEGMAIGMRYGVDGKTLYKCVKGSSGDSWVMDFAQPAPGVIDWSASSNGFEPLFTPRLCVKDISLGIKMAEDVGIHATMGEVAVKLFSKTDEDPRTKRLDCSSIWLHVNKEVDEFEKKLEARK